MKGLLAILLTASFAATAGELSCARLRDVAVANENDYLRAKATSCSNMSIQIEGIDAAVVNRVLASDKCGTLASVTERLHTLENEIALMSGFDKLKDEIRTQKEAVVDVNETKSQRAAKKFQKALGVAQTLDLILNTEGEEPLIRQLKALPLARRNDPVLLKEAVRTLCRNRQYRQANDDDACRSGFNPNIDSVRELNALLDRSELTDQQIASFENALKIKKRNNEDYSFRQMGRDLQGAIGSIADAKLNLSRQQIAAIQQIPDFQSFDALPILNDLRAKVPEMAMHVSLEKFRLFSEELTDRQITETRSKISFAWSQARSTNNLTPEEVANCNQSRQNFDKAKLCWTAMKAKRSSMTANGSEVVTNLEMGIDNSLAYMLNLDKTSACLNVNHAALLAKVNAGNELTDPDCNHLASMHEALAQKVAESKVLEKIRQNILEAPANARLEKIRNFTLEKLEAKAGCTDVMHPNVSCEDYPNLGISPEAVSLTSEVLGMSIVRTGPLTPTDITDICDEDNADSVPVCTYLRDDPSTVPNVTDRPAPSSVSPYIEPTDQRDPSREAFRDGLSMLSIGALQALTAPKPMYGNPYANYNPYPYSYNPYAGIGALSPSDQILFNARYFGGYGVYTGTLGAAPYTAFPIISPYVQAAAPAAGNTSSYFSNFGTYK